MLFSIITVSLNAENLINDTIKSVLNQTFDDYEIIVKDGLSTDNTIKNIPKDRRIRIIEKKDTGIYQAMNQGIKEAKGEYLLFLNCGDTLFDNSVLEKVSQIIGDDRKSIFYGNFKKENIIYKSPKKVRKILFYDSTLCHQVAFFPRYVFDKVGMYDETLKITSDSKYFLDCKIQKIPYRHMDLIVCVYLEGGVSETEYGIELAKEEKKECVKTRFNFFDRILYRFLKSGIGQSILKIKNSVNL